MEGMIEINRTCPHCGKNNTIYVQKDKYYRWMNGELVQNCFADSPDKDREILITGICPKCWDSLFKDM